jgi:hypothetical protein
MEHSWDLLFQLMKHGTNNLLCVYIFVHYIVVCVWCTVDILSYLCTISTNVYSVKTHSSSGSVCAHYLCVFVLFLDGVEGLVLLNNASLCGGMRAFPWLSHIQTQHTVNPVGVQALPLAMDMRFHWQLPMWGIVLIPMSNSRGRHA